MAKRIRRRPSRPALRRAELIGRRRALARRYVGELDRPPKVGEGLRLTLDDGEVIITGAVERVLALVGSPILMIQTRSGATYRLRYSPAAAPAPRIKPPYRLSLR